MTKPRPPSWTYLGSPCLAWRLEARRPQGSRMALNWRILKALTSSGEAAKVQENNSSSTPDLRGRTLYCNCSAVCCVITHFLMLYIHCLARLPRLRTLLK